MTASGADPGSQQPRFRNLARDECEQLLDRNHIGRIAFAFHDRVDIAPIHYVYSNEWIYFRTSQGTKFSTISHHRWVAFEVDECEGMFDWRSVVVKGTCYVLDPDTSTHQDPAYAQGVTLLRKLIPETFTGADPVPFRQSVFRIHLDEVTGREARSKGLV